MFTVTEKIIKKKGVSVWYLPVLTVWNPSVLSLAGCRGARGVAWKRRKRLGAAAMEKYEKIKVVGRGAFG